MKKHLLSWLALALLLAALPLVLGPGRGEPQEPAIRWLPPGLEVQGVFGETLLLVRDPAGNFGLVSRAGETVLPPVYGWIGSLT